MSDKEDLINDQIEEEDRDSLFLDIDAPKNECVYFIDTNTYVQYSGKGRLPSQVKTWAQEHDGELPPRMPLPNRAVEFHMDEQYSGQYTIPWLGKGKLPPPVLEYLKEHGTLPRNTTLHKQGE